MDKETMLKSNEFRTGLLFSWLAGLLLFALVFSLYVPNFGFATFTFGFTCVLAIMSAVYYMALGYYASNGYEQVNVYTEQEEENETVQESTTVQNTSVQLSDEAKRYYETLSFFVQQVIEKRLLSQPAWEREHQWPASAFDYYIAQLQEASIVAPPEKPGKGRTLLVDNLETAWEKLDAVDGFNIRLALEYNRRIRTQGKDLALSPSEQNVKA